MAQVQEIKEPGSHKALLVEDEQYLWRFITGHLESRGYKVDVVRTAREGRDIFFGDPTGFELVLSDNNTGGGFYGIDLLTFVRRDGPKNGPRFILMSGDSVHNGQDLKKLVEDQKAEFLAKPFRLETLQKLGL